VIRGFLAVGDNIIVIPNTNMGAGISQGIDALLGKGVIDYNITATEQNIVFNHFHHAVEGMIIAMDIGYD